VRHALSKNGNGTWNRMAIVKRETAAWVNTCRVRHEHANRCTQFQQNLSVILMIFVVWCDECGEGAWGVHKKCRCSILLITPATDVDSLFNPEELNKN